MMEGGLRWPYSYVSMMARPRPVSLHTAKAFCLGLFRRLGSRRVVPRRCTGQWAAHDFGDVQQDAYRIRGMIFESPAFCMSK
jgi:hypothetical protein